MAARPILQIEGLSLMKCLRVRLVASLQVFRVDILCPAIAEFRVERAAGKLQPSLIDIAARLINSGHPNHHRRRVSNQPEPFFTFLQRLCSSPAFRDVTYGGLGAHNFAGLTHDGDNIDFYPLSLAIRTYPL